MEVDDEEEMNDLYVDPDQEVGVCSAIAIGKYADQDLAIPKAPQLPVVLCTGLLARHHGRFDYRKAIPKWMATNGVKVVIVHAPMTASIETRANALKKKIEKVISNLESPYGARFRTELFLQTRKVHLVAHSLGGLDCRYYITKLGGHERVFTLTTVATPHRGSPVAEWAVSPEGPLHRFKLEYALKVLGMSTCAFHQLTPKFLEQFNREVCDHPNVHYVSYSGVIDTSKLSHKSVLYWLSKKMKDFGANDGVVSEESAKWGHYRGHVEVSHVEMTSVNKVRDIRILYRDVAMRQEWAEGEKACGLLGVHTRETNAHQKQSLSCSSGYCEPMLVDSA
eukprot:TRINITY_DN2130_c0_g1_i1.p1 TRINITY_DN2130_c0_g1~~TRINITY_DN2130_c0_g1_i1.p1  ORF type:complete len:372 (+),score=46.75 TRINITY_DN2130_c0_g1_i1:106-1116(+)